MISYESFGSPHRKEKIANVLGIAGCCQFHLKDWNI